jgi:hypothetical protein
MEGHDMAPKQQQFQSDEPEVGHQYKHYQRDITVEVLCIAFDGTVGKRGRDARRVVVYRDEKGQMWFQPYGAWMGSYINKKRWTRV